MVSEYRDPPSENDVTTVTDRWQAPQPARALFETGTRGFRYFTWRRMPRGPQSSSNSRFSPTTTKSRLGRLAGRSGAPNKNPAQGMGIRAPTERGSEIPRGTLGWGV